MIVAIAPAGTGIVPIEELRMAVDTATAVSNFCNEYSPPKLTIDYIGHDTGWTEPQAPTGDRWKFDHDAIPPALLDDGVVAPLAEFLAGEQLNQNVLAFSLDAWTTLGVRIVSNPVSAVGAASRALGVATLVYRCDGTGCKVRMMEDDLTTQVAVSDEIELPDSVGAWAFYKFVSNVDPREGINRYYVEGNRLSTGTATLADVEELSIAMMRKQN